MTPRVLVADPLSGPGLEILRDGGRTDVVVRDAITASELLTAISDFDAIVVRSRTRVTRDMFDRAPRLRVVGRCGVGLDNIDVEAARARGIVVVSAAGATAVSVAELTMALILCLARRIPAADASTRTGAWERKAFEGIEVAGKTLAILGLGNIGREVALRAQAFGMRVLFHDPYLPPHLRVLPGAEEREFIPLLLSADILTVHVPLLPETRHMISQDALSRMKRGAMLVNVARGGIVDEAALLAAVRAGQIAGAALDVFEAEPPAGSELLREPRIVVTPHIGASTPEAQERAGLEVARRVLEALPTS